MMLAAAWIPASHAARTSQVMHIKPTLKFGSMAVNLQQAAVQSFLRGRVAAEDKEIAFEKERANTEEEQVAELASRLDFEERRTARLEARVNFLEQSATTSMAKLQA